MSEMTREQLHDVLHKYLANGTPITVFFDIGETFDALQSQLAALRQERDAAERNEHAAMLKITEVEQRYAELQREAEAERNGWLGELNALRLRWTRERPTVAGGYWWRNAHGIMFFMGVQSIESASGEKWCEIHSTSHYDQEQFVGRNVNAINGEWAGPIPLPQGREA